MPPGLWLIHLLSTLPARYRSPITNPKPTASVQRQPVQEHCRDIGDAAMARLCAQRRVERGARARNVQQFDAQVPEELAVARAARDLALIVLAGMR